MKYVYDSSKNDFITFSTMKQEFSTSKTKTKKTTKKNNKNDKLPKVQDTFINDQYRKLEKDMKDQFQKIVHVYEYPIKWILLDLYPSLNKSTSKEQYIQKIEYAKSVGLSSFILLHNLKNIHNYEISLESIENIVNMYTERLCNDYQKKKSLEIVKLYHELLNEFKNLISTQRIP